jgi:hypothetical protein
VNKKLNYKLTILSVGICYSSIFLITLYGISLIYSKVVHLNYSSNSFIDTLLINLIGGYFPYSFIIIALICFLLGSWIMICFRNEHTDVFSRIICLTTILLILLYGCMMPLFRKCW